MVYNTQGGRFNLNIHRKQLIDVYVYTTKKSYLQIQNISFIVGIT